MIRTTTQVLNNILYGVSLGYPSCCIEYFHLRQVNGDMFQEIFEDNLKDNKRKLNGTGFICCPNCNSNYSESKLIENINDNRYVSNKFPYKGTPEINDNLYPILMNDPITSYTFNVVIETLKPYVDLIDDI